MRELQRLYPLAPGNNIPIVIVKVIQQVRLWESIRVTCLILSLPFQWRKFKYE